MLLFADFFYHARQMVDLYDKVVKMMAKAKGTIKRHHIDQLKSAAANGSSLSLDATNPDQTSTIGKKQKTRSPPEVSPIVADCTSYEYILPPPCTLHRGLLLQKNFLLQKDEAKYIIIRNKVTRAKKLSVDIKGMMRVDALAMALNTQRVCPYKDYDALKCEYDDLDVAFESHKDKYRIQADIVEDLCKANDKIMAMGRRIKIYASA